MINIFFEKYNHRFKLVLLQCGFVVEYVKLIGYLAFTNNLITALWIHHNYLPCLPAEQASKLRKKLHILEVTNNHGDTLGMHLLSLFLFMVFFVETDIGVSIDTP